MSRKARYWQLEVGYVNHNPKDFENDPNAYSCFGHEYGLGCHRCPLNEECREFYWEICDELVDDTCIVIVEESIPNQKVCFGTEVRAISCRGCICDKECFAHARLGIKAQGIVIVEETP